MKSHVRVFLELAICIYKDAVAMCTELQLDYRDVDTLTARVTHEGMSFLTITLPSLGSDLDRSLSNGTIGSTAFRSFAKVGKAPAFMQGFFSRVFDEHGRIFDEPDEQAIEGLRQIAYFLKKVKMPCSAKRVASALKGFVDSELVFKDPLSTHDTENFIRVSRLIWPGLLFGNEQLTVSNLVPKHGPGATEEKLSGNAKFDFRKWHDRLEPYFPLLDSAFVNTNVMNSSWFEKVNVVQECDEKPVRIITVPKTLKTPRIIAIEPVCMQYTQQAVSRALVRELEYWSLTAGHLNFSDQTVNQELAMSSSADGLYATLDMSSASDLVPYELALRMFDSNPDLQGAISACRSKRAQMPDGSIVELSKFASMGSALCFPIEAMYFYTICVLALLEKYDLPSTWPSIQKVAKQVYVYGDDIIVPTDSSDVVISCLQKYYCKVNASKSYYLGSFRESCGMDAFNGKRVTPTYVREQHPRNKLDAGALVSWTATANLLRFRGFQQSARYMFLRVERHLGYLPVVSDTCSGLGKVSVFSDDGPPRSCDQILHSCSKRFKARLNVDTQQMEIKLWVPSPIYTGDTLDDYPALLKCLLKLANVQVEPFWCRSFNRLNRVKSVMRQADSWILAYLERMEKPSWWVSTHFDSKTIQTIDSCHLEKLARHGAVTLKRRWVKIC